MSRPEGPPGHDSRPQPGRLRAILLAVIVHAAFFGLIVFGVTWNTRAPAPVEAELWKDLPKGPAKPAPPPEPPKVEPKPEPPKVEPKPEPPPPPPPKPEPEPKVEPPKPDPAIALKLEREKQEREKKARAEEAKREKEKREQEAKKKREQEEAKKKREEEAREKQRRAEEERLRAEAQAAREAAASAREKEVASWTERIRNRIRGRANVPDTVTGRPEVTVRIRILPGGEVLDISITRPSGNPAYDSAIERAIRSASPLPVPPANSELFPQFRDLNLQIRHER